MISQCDTVSASGRREYGRAAPGTQHKRTVRKNMMKKWISLLLALVMLLCVACGEKDTGDQAAPAGVYYEVTGIDPQAAALTVDGTEIPIELYCYWIAYNCSGLEYNLGMMNSMYGLYAELFNEDGTMKWDMPLDNDLTIAQMVKDKSVDSALFYATVENMAKEHGVVLTEDDEATLAKSKEAAVEEMGGQEEFKTYLDQLGITEASFDRMAADNQLFNGLSALVLQEGSPLYLEDAGYADYAMYADHILLTTVDSTTNQPLSEEEIAKKKQTAEDLLSQLQSAQDMPALFAQLADEYSEDPGRKASPNGYIFQSGEFVAPFEEAVKTLEPGQLSGLVESDYGFHIILRKDLTEGLAENADKKAQLASIHLSSLVQAQADKAKVEYSEEMESIDPAVFYPAYVALMDQRLGPDTEGSTGSDLSDVPSVDDAADSANADAADGDKPAE